MVLIWNELAGGDSELCAVMVAFNSVLQIVLYAPLSLLYLQVRRCPAPLRCITAWLLLHASDPLTLCTHLHTRVLLLRGQPLAVSPPLTHTRSAIDRVVRLLQVVSGASGIQVGFWPVAKSVLLFLGVPLVAGERAARLRLSAAP